MKRKKSLQRAQKQQGKKEATNTSVFIEREERERQSEMIEPNIRIS
jgi:hypothetical protein